MYAILEFLEIYIKIRKLKLVLEGLGRGEINIKETWQGSGGRKLEWWDCIRIRLC